MKKNYSLMLFGIMFAQSLLAAQPAGSANMETLKPKKNADSKVENVIKTLTFEDADYKGGANMTGKYDWTSLIDQQYGGPLLYGESGYGSYDIEDAYKWTDANNTWLSHTITEAYDSWAYWNGGHAVSNYGSGDISDYGDYTAQLTVYKAGASGLVQEGCGHNGSNNFAVHFGYADDSPYALGSEYLPVLSFADGQAYCIDHMFVNCTTYSMNCYIDGNSLTPNISEGDYVKIVATGFNGDETTGTAEIYLCNGPDNYVTDWTKFDLSSLGKVTKVKFNVVSNVGNGYGTSVPAYFAYDDVAVVVEPATSVTVGETGWASACLSYDAVVPEGTKAYYASYFDGSEVTFTEVTEIPAGEGFFFNAPVGTYEFEKAESEVPSISNKLCGVTESTLLNANSVYVLTQLDDSNVGMKKYSGTVITGNHAFLNVPTVLAKSSLRVVFSEATGINEVEAPAVDNGAIYNLNGQRVSETEKGKVYIKNGKKYISE